VRVNGGHAGARRPLTYNQRAFSVDDGSVADPHARQVSDGVQFAGRQGPDGDAEVA
jgi:hypothetical protein